LLLGDLEEGVGVGREAAVGGGLVDAADVDGRSQLGLEGDGLEDPSVDQREVLEPQDHGVGAAPFAGRLAALIGRVADAVHVILELVVAGPAVEALAQVRVHVPLIFVDTWTTGCLRAVHARARDVPAAILALVFVVRGVVLDVRNIVQRCVRDDAEDCAATAATAADESALEEIVAHGPIGGLVPIELFAEALVADRRPVGRNESHEILGAITESVDPTDAAAAAAAEGDESFFDERRTYTEVLRRVPSQATHEAGVTDRPTLRDLVEDELLFGGHATGLSRQASL
jgi:hypothetical protein